MLADDFNISARKAIQWTAEQLTDKNKAFLFSLPMLEHRENILFVHASPQSLELWDYILDAEDAASAMKFYDEKLCFIGHTHVPKIFSIQGLAKSITRDEQF